MGFHRSNMKMIIAVLVLVTLAAAEKTPERRFVPDESERFVPDYHEDGYHPRAKRGLLRNDYVANPGEHKYVADTDYRLKREADWDLQEEDVYGEPRLLPGYP